MGGVLRADGRPCRALFDDSAQRESEGRAFGSFTDDVERRPVQVEDAFRDRQAVPLRSPAWCASLGTAIA